MEQKSEMPPEDAVVVKPTTPEERKIEFEALDVGVNATYDTIAIKQDGKIITMSPRQADDVVSAIKNIQKRIRIFHRVDKKIKEVITLVDL